MSTNQIGKLLCAEGPFLYFINETENGVVKVNTSSFDTIRIPMGDDKIYQISVTNSRVYAISENGTLQVCFRKRDKILGQVQKNHMNDSDDDDHMSDDEGKTNKYATTVVKITPNADAVCESDALNKSIIAGSDDSDNDDSPNTLSLRSKIEQVHPCK